jgi:hypothetical protein
MPNISILQALATRLCPTPVPTCGVRIVNLEELLQASAAAEIEWSNELRRLWAGRADKTRFVERGTSSPRLRKLHEDFRATHDRYMEALAADREPLPCSNCQSRNHASAQTEMPKAA